MLIRGPFIAEGTENNKIIVKSLDPEKPFGTFSIYPENNNSKVKLTNFEINGGNEAIIDGVYFSGQISIHSANVFINNSSFINSKSDDGINIKFSEVAIKNSNFINNIGDGIDLDYCKGIFINNKLIFENYEGLNNIETDGLDISGTDIKIQENTFEKFSDKGISVGEKSYPLISMNTFNNNKMAIAIKDSSIAKVEKNIFHNNKEDITLYIKKKLYKAPKLIMNKDNANLNIKNIKGEIIYQ
jgi:parallel beta-helix repeat protein